ncbi:MAG TPA: L-threonylcarbamoyladenylate synthase [Candidatus Nanopelagicaceae bacterium]|jgi:L-threonylcarbamoyladenylate synthase|nr:L-threonylcarbamoyladenylate synthase [Candidatus Nanopelagicaceae bacterium]
MGFLIKLKGKKIQDLEFVLEIAVENIIEGKLIAFPTNSVYGLGGDPLNLEVINRIYDIKYRDRSKGLLLLVADTEEAEKVADFNKISYRLAERFWPGQLTLILKKKELNIIPPEVTAFKNTIGIRVPENEIILTILKKLKLKGYFGGIIGTSANYSGEPPSISGDEVAKKFLTPIDLILDGGKTQTKISTTILDCTSEELKLLRIGIIKEEEIEDYIESN